MNRITFSLLILSTLVFAAPRSGAAAVIETVSVGLLNNTPDVNPYSGDPYGEVDYRYRIGKYEVTNAQYAEFLNAKAKSDPFGLYSTAMASDVRGGITRGSGVGGFAYSVKTNMANKPVIYVNWYDAIRLMNWMQNGQGTGSTETGAYTLLGGTPVPSNAATITRTPGAVWYLPTEDEWYKAAYYQPAQYGGDSDSYWLYATRTNTLPSAASANSVGNISNPGSNVANYDSRADWNAQNGNVTTVGSAGNFSASYFGTFDQEGNVKEWTEGAAVRSFELPWRFIRSTSFNDPASNMYGSAFSGSVEATADRDDLGFRIVMVPEPASMSLALVGFGTLICLRLRPRRPL